MHCIAKARRCTMQTNDNTRRALARFALVTAAAIAAAGVWASNRPEQGLLLDAQTWRDEVLTATTEPWPADGWYRLVAQDDGVDVRAVRPTARQAIPADAVYFRLRGTTLKTGLRTSEQGQEQWGQPQPGRYSLHVDEVDAGVQYAIGYGGHTYTYLVGPRGVQTRVAAVADLDGDHQPDFLVHVCDRAVYLLLSSRAEPGANLPTAELPADGC
jgi:hypothetical protein